LSVGFFLFAFFFCRFSDFFHFSGGRYFCLKYLDLFFGFFQVVHVFRIGEVGFKRNDLCS
jgi:hypothetical protein